MKFFRLKKIPFHSILLLICLPQISNCMSPEQRALMAKSLKDRCACYLIKKNHIRCHGNKKALQAYVLGDPYKTLDLSATLAKWFYLLYRKKGYSISQT